MTQPPGQENTSTPGARTAHGPHGCGTQSHDVVPPHARSRGLHRALSGVGTSLYVSSQYSVAASQSWSLHAMNAGGTGAHVLTTPPRGGQYPEQHSSPTRQGVPVGAQVPASAGGVVSHVPSCA